MKKFRAVMAVMVILVLVLSIPASAHGTGKSYVYNHSGTAQEIPDPYQIKTTVGYDLGMTTPVDMVVRNDLLYILDAGHTSKDLLGVPEDVKEASDKTIAESNAKIEELEGKIAEIEEMITPLEDEVEAIEAEIAAAQEAAAGEDEAATSEEAATSDEEATTEDVPLTPEQEAIAALEAEIAALEEQITAHRDEISAAEEAIQKAENQITRNTHSTRLLILDKNYNKVGEEYFFNNDGVVEKDTDVVTDTPSAFAFDEPRGLWIDEAGRVYVTDRSKHFLFVFVWNETYGKYIIDTSLNKPNSPMIQYEDAAYLPTKVLTDHLGVIYIRVENDYRGFLMIQPNWEDGTGEFLGYFGSNEVVRTAEAVMLQFWKRFMTEEQLKRIEQLLPMEYSNFCIDNEGAFIYGVRGSTEDMTELIRKINCKGKNVLDYQSRFGDIGLTRVNGKYISTNFNAITVDDAGFITTFDASWQRLFQYTPEGDLMYVFGGKGTQEGTFERGADIENWGEDLLVLDEVYATVTVLEPTTFGKNIREGEIRYIDGDYEGSKPYFKDVVEECMNYEFGYQGIGKALYMEGAYTEAMDMFYLAHDQANYSMAFKMYRAEIMRSMTVPAVIIVIVAVVLWAVYAFLKSKGIIKTKKLVLDESGKLKYVLHTLFHPIEGYEEMRYNKKYSLTIANIAIFFFFFSSVIMSLYSGFIFNGTSAQSYNMVFTIVGVLGGFTLFALVNWLMATFFEGKGNFKEVWIYLGYATIPYSVTCFLYTLLSNVLTLEESTFLGYLMIVGQGWAIVMVWFALQGLHMYSFWRNFWSILVTLGGMLVVLFIVFLMFNLFIQFFAFGESIFTEVMYRLAVGF